MIYINRNPLIPYYIYARTFNNTSDYAEGEEAKREELIRNRYSYKNTLKLHNALDICEKMYNFAAH